MELSAQAPVRLTVQVQILASVWTLKRRLTKTSFDSISIVDLAQ